MFAVFRAKKGSKPVRVSPEYADPDRCQEFMIVMVANGIGIADCIVMRRTQRAVKSWERYDPLFDNTTAR